ncbi:protein-methionine-sulfoxide reductase heme-binding subunit MsrQ [Shewanella sp. JM162201]|uniref:Protein-methionine-sulfoxide reductase heme-binding subunit MsrQ n=1 Tax=Shewanella jiangmenensis TaxID=2837387 RepID=A0ABS5V506_9GAMM|nr:protein-methionine-sulfoxide reductase heme-binding subunit MsrQ [Shewanella jiangmenensis]MBT1445542.1 protein-methionine-sulfoxide reductase heme-binding subunit MsrQ [Shewanella jiangmenensis]
MSAAPEKVAASPSITPASRSTPRRQPRRLSRRALLWFKGALHLVFSLPLLWLIYGVNQGLLGGDPVQYLIHFTGKGALNILLVTLLVSPLAKALQAGFLLECRRLIGLWSFAYAGLHLAIFISLDLLFAFNLLFSEVIKRPYLVVGMLAFIVLLLLAVTSFNRLRRRMGKGWQLLHNLIYLAAPVIVLHYAWSVKSGLIEPMLYGAAVAVLLWIRRAKLVAIVTSARRAV